jgi:hypothetical protein
MRSVDIPVELAVNQCEVANFRDDAWVATYMVYSDEISLVLKYHHLQRCMYEVSLCLTCSSYS